MRQLAITVDQNGTQSGINSQNGAQGSGQNGGQSGIGVDGNSSLSQDARAAAAQLAARQKAKVHLCLRSNIAHYYAERSPLLPCAAKVVALPATALLPCHHRGYRFANSGL